MTRKNAHQEKRFFSLLSLRGGKPFIAIFLALFLLGCSLTAAAEDNGPPGEPPPPQQLPPPVQPPPVQASNCPCGPACTGSCEPPNTTEQVVTFLITDLLNDLTTASATLENWMFTYISAIVQSEYDQIAWLENEMIDWWNTMWYYNQLPGLQSMTRQLNVDLALQALQLQANADSSAMMAADRNLAKHGIADQEMSPEEQVCVAATQGGGLTRSSSFGRAARHAWETKALMAGLNTTVDADGNANPGAASAAGSDYKRYQDWQNIFCDPLGNSVSAVPCGTSGNLAEPLYNMDALPVRYLFNSLTIPLDDPAMAGEGPQVELGIEDLINNLVGLPAMDAITPGALSSPTGQAGYLTRRSYLARYAAIRSVPDMVAGWRIPGSQMGQWVKDLRENAGLPVASYSTAGGQAVATYGYDPSYKEIMHALSVDRFNSGVYAVKTITDPGKVEQEKLEISAFYLMQLRDYYELLERTALTLAVQVSLLDEQASMANSNLSAPVQ